MQTHAIRDRAATQHARPAVKRSGFTRPAVISALYGAYAGFLDQDSGASATRAALLGLIAGAVLLALWLVIARLLPSGLLREARSAVCGALAGSAFGLLAGLSGASILRSAVLGLVVGLAVGLATNYRLYGRVR